ncbi:4-amino-4-deoxy-L-arabinose transferase-like glycosyltransferase [Sphingomonas sp. SORGH_AS438]|nr:4-amino-4-deoxy-L-arabinose transferase-like glycosyltransferase [Sphingomonas sp. SORGH_AS_0438]
MTVQHDPGSSSPGQRPAVILAAMLVLALLLRGWDFGNPVLDIDEQWYLLVGDRMLHGAVPFIDLWDRKPYGLFLLFAGFRLIPADGIIVYQVAAALFAGTTAAVILHIARRLGAAPVGAWSAGILYLLTMAVIGGQGGQSPVFYNLPVALAALLTLRLPSLTGERAAQAIGRNGLAACALCGLAIQIKYTAAFEGLFIGLAHLWAIVRVRRPGVTIGWTLAWGVAGIAPTLAVGLAYAMMGAGAFQAFWFANFVSITLRQAYPAGKMLLNLGGLLAQITPLLIAAGVTLARIGPRAARHPVHALAIGWLLAAVIGFACIGTFYDHYGLPLLPPLAALAGWSLGRSTKLRTIVVLAAMLVFIGERVDMPDDRAAIAPVVALMRANHGTGTCPYVFNGPSILYYLADSCIPTPYAFPNTLGHAIEGGATGVDEGREVARIMATRPPVVVTLDRATSFFNPASLAAVTLVLARDYCLAMTLPRDKRKMRVYTRCIRPTATRAR